VKRVERHNFLAALGAGGLVVLFCLVLLWHDPLLFWNDDYELSILPVFSDVARSWSHGEWPLLSPYSWVCGNLAGEYQYGTFSIFVNAIVVLIWKFPAAFPQQAAALSMAHLFVLGMGGYLLARGRNLAPSLSAMVALVAALNGWIICWGATDWFGALGAFAWLPWAWWGMERALDVNRTRWRFLWPVPFVYLVVAGGFPYTVLMLGLVAVWLATKSLGETRRFSAILPLIAGLLLGFGLSAPAWLALLDYVHGSVRSDQEASQHFQWQVPIAALPGFILPSWTVKWADFSSRFIPHTAAELATGLVPPAALLAGLITFGRRFVRTIKWELALLLVALLLCLLPTANVFRWSFRWLPLFHLALALCAAESLRLFGATTMPALRRPGTVALIITLVVTGAAWIAGTNGPLGFPFVWITIGLAAAWAVIEILPPNIRRRGPVFILLASFLATYLCIPPNCGVPKYNLAEELNRPTPLDPERLYLSLYPPPEDAYRVEKRSTPFGTTVRPGSTSMFGEVRLVNGYSPIRPAGVAREFMFAIHGEVGADAGYQLLYHESGSEGILARLGVDGVIVSHETGGTPQPETEWELAAETDEGRVFHRLGAPLASLRSVTAIDSRPNEQFVVARISNIVDRRNRIEAQVVVPPGAAPALVTVARPFFRGYQARIGDHELRVDSYRGLMPTIEIPPGLTGRLTLIYRPRWLVVGITMAAFCALLWIGGVLAAVRFRRVA
jgi:hypothetical protein